MWKLDAVLWTIQVDRPAPCCPHEEPASLVHCTDARGIQVLAYGSFVLVCIPRLLPSEPCFQVRSLTDLSASIRFAGIADAGIIMTVIGTPRGIGSSRNLPDGSRSDLRLETC